MASPYRRIACCIDRDGMEDAVIGEALALAGDRPGVVHAVHVLAPPSALVSGPFTSVPPASETREDAEAWLADVAERHPDLASTSILEGEPARAVCEWAGPWGADLLVAAARRRLLERVVVGGFAARLAYHAPCAVLLLHGPVAVQEDVAASAAGP